MAVPSLPVIPAKAGIHAAASSLDLRWIPAFAGMTMRGFAHTLTGE
jgi:hypothetical protein